MQVITVIFIINIGQNKTKKKENKGQKWGIYHCYD